jgi:hypothetical protein
MQEKKKSCASCNDPKFYLRWEFIFATYIFICGIKETVDIIKYLISLF